MDVRYFLKKRTDFLRRHYDTIARAFDNEQRKIQENETHYENPEYTEDPEPPFVEEWMEAETSKNLTGLACISMLSEALKLYFEEVRLDIGFEFDEPKKVFKRGFVEPYREALGEIFETTWTDAGIDFAFIEQIVLARNLAQHGGCITSWDITYDAHTLEKHKTPFFADADELEEIPNIESASFSFLAPSINVTRERLFAALDEVDKLADWIEENINRARSWRKKSGASIR